MAHSALLLLVTWGALLPTCGSTRAQAISHAPVHRIPLAAHSFRNGKTIHFPDGEVVALLTFKPVHTRGMTSYPGGPPLRLPHGYEVVETTWAVHNTTRQVIGIKTWRATSLGKVSAMFVTGNAAELGTVQPGATWRYDWLFIVADTGRVAIYYGPFRAHWLPRG